MALLGLNLIGLGILAVHKLALLKYWHVCYQPWDYFWFEYIN